MTPDVPPERAGHGSRRAQLSAAELGARVRDTLPDAASVSPEELELVEAVRSLPDAVLRSDVGDDVRARLAQTVREVIDQLRSVERSDLVRLARRGDGGIENLVQAAAGRCNPRSLRLVFDEQPPPGPDGSPDPLAVIGRVVLDASAAGPPERAHGGIVATILDEASGVAMTRAGRTGMTAAIEVSFRAGAPIGVPLEVRARCVELDGRKTRVAAELTAAGDVVATATALYVASRSGAAAS